jgi:hypothetical protein
MSSSIKTPFDCSIAEMKVIEQEVLDFYKNRIGSKWMSLRFDFDAFRAFNVAVFKVSQDIKHATKSKTHEVLWKTPKPFVSAKRLLGWFITGKDFHAIPQGQRWASYADVLGEDTFLNEIGKAFLKVSEGNNFELVFVDAAQFTEGAESEGDLVPVLTWIKPATGPESGPYKTAALKTTPEPVEEKPVLVVSAGAGGNSWADMVSETTVSKPEPETTVSKPEPESESTVSKFKNEKISEMTAMAAIMLLRTLIGPNNTLSHETIDTLAVEVIKATQKLIEA